MDKSLLPRDLRPFLDDAGRLRQWPSRVKVQRMATALLARRFELGRDYSEKDVNALLMDAHTFADWALLRRSLVDWGLMTRESDCSRYRLSGDAPQAIARELDTPGATA
jgi:hypothetical protein